MGTRKQITPTSLPLLQDFLKKALPGRSRAIERVREQVLDFAVNPVSKALLLQGPVGAGKTTVSRAVAMLKRIAPLNARAAEQFTKLADLDAWGRFSPMLMPWYMEFPVTGLNDSLVDVQLFGAMRGAYTDGIERPGIFEAAQLGQGCSKGKEDPGSLLTGGVVFLDEIGDLSLAHQAKLLPVLSGGSFYRLGDEGSRSNQLQFRGVTISATWRPLSQLRADLYSRISSYRIEIPGLLDRMEDFDLIVSELESTIIRSAKAEIDRLRTIGQGQVDRAYWEQHEKSIVGLTHSARARLRKVDWQAHGNVRGLTAVLQKILVGNETPDDAISTLASPTGEARGPSDVAALFELLVSRQSADLGLAGRLREIEVEQRGQLRTFLEQRTEARERLAQALGIDDTRLTQQMQQLDRRRTSAAQPSEES